MLQCSLLESLNIALLYLGLVTNYIYVYTSSHDSVLKVHR